MLYELAVRDEVLPDEPGLVGEVELVLQPVKA